MIFRIDQLLLKFRNFLNFWDFNFLELSIALLAVKIRQSENKCWIAFSDSEVYSEVSELRYFSLYATWCLIKCQYEVSRNV